MTPPLVSVIIPVYRGSAYIGGTLASLQAQTFDDFEVLCVDDCSPDDSQAVIAEAMRGDPRIRYVPTPGNLGIVPRVMNFARDHVRGRHFVYSSQDDNFSSDWLDSMVTTARQTDADAVVPNLSMVDAAGAVISRKVNDWREPVTGEEAFLLSLDWTIPTNALWPVSLLADPGYADFGTYADEYSGRLFFLRCRRVAFASGEFLYFQGNPQAITKQVSPRLLDATDNEWRIWRLVHERFPGHDWDRRYAAYAFVSLIESYVRLVAHPALRSEKKRLRPPMEKMRDQDFLRALHDHYGDPLLGGMARLTIRHEAVLWAVATILFVGRRVKAGLRRLVRRDRARATCRDMKREWD